MANASSQAAPPRLLILGTAGHIDHGKSSLVKALTGTDPDRLPEEKARGMTIELGFAQLEMPGVRFGVVDVPGHERFIRTMVSGATGIDLGMLVVAADDGVMPQTREHVEILDLLGVQAGVVALNKSDMVDHDRIQQVREQIAGVTARTALGGWNVVPVSAVTGTGLDELRTELRRVAESLPPRQSSSIFRLAIDRVFAVQGRGTVVTGSVLSGTVAPGAALELQPGPIPCRVREIESHGKSAADVRAGQRAALNLTGIDREHIHRGQELATPGFLSPSRYLDARIRLLARRDSAGSGLASFRLVRVEMATWEQIAVLVALEADEIAPGDAALVQLRFRRPVVAAWGQRFIIREENGEATLGGGIVLRPVSRRLSRRQADEVEGLRTLESTGASARVAEVVRNAGFSPLKPESFACRAGIEPADVAAIRAELRKSIALISPVGNVEVHASVVSGLRDRAVAFLTRHHRKSPGEPGMPVERFVGWIDRRAVPGVGRAIFGQLQNQGEVVVRGPFVAHRSFRPALSPEDEKLMAGLIQELRAAGLDPPTWDKLRSVAGQSKQRQNKLLELARSDPRVVLIAPQHFAAAEAVEQFRSCIRNLGAGGSKFTLAQVRDRLNLSRRAVQPFLEYFDRIRETKRVGDERVLTAP